MRFRAPCSSIVLLGSLPANASAETLALITPGQAGTMSSRRCCTFHQTLTLRELRTPRGCCARHRQSISSPHLSRSSAARDFRVRGGIPRSKPPNPPELCVAVPDVQIHTRCSRSRIPCSPQKEIADYSSEKSAGMGCQARMQTTLGGGNSLYFP